MSEKIRRVAPRELSAEARELWRACVYEFELEAHHEQTLKQALRCLDRANEAAAIVDRDGCVVLDRFGQVKEHPACSIERMNRLAYARLLREIGLDHVPEVPRGPTLTGR